MRILLITALSAAAVSLAACTTVNTSAPPPSSASPSQSATGAPTPTPTGPTAPTSPAVPIPPAPPRTTSPPPPVTVPNVTSPWAVVSAYYAAIESGNFAEAWALIGSGATTGQTYQEFVDGFACTGAQAVTNDGVRGDQVSFTLTAVDTCTGHIQTFSGTDTVRNGVIVAADVIQTS